MSECTHCKGLDGEELYPHVGVGPHQCYYAITGAVIGESKPLPKDQWPDNYREDPECPGLGVYWCPECNHGHPDIPLTR